MGDFGNEFGENLQMGVAVFIVFAAPLFGFFFNRLIDHLPENEHTSLYVVIGVAVTLVFVGLLSWKAALLSLVIFGLTGLPMIAGDFRRSLKAIRSAPRRKRLPYVANAHIDSILMSVASLNRLSERYLENTDQKLILKMQLEHMKILSSANELKNIQKDK